ncbi:hypothetical protein HOD75_03885 [archaeon]|jgi:hypothetical protein|nr:hypothetical protein [archaeon]MBT4242011.1 hypothetical protein [archaeon]MBT4418558.1 hypothetical protein [archaeon]
MKDLVVEFGEVSDITFSELKMLKCRICGINFVGYEDVEKEVVEEMLGSSCEKEFVNDINKSNSNNQNCCNICKQGQYPSN